MKKRQQSVKQTKEVSQFYHNVTSDKVITFCFYNFFSDAKKNIGLLCSLYTCRERVNKVINLLAKTPLSSSRIPFSVCCSWFRVDVASSSSCINQSINQTIEKVIFNVFQDPARQAIHCIGSESDCCTNTYKIKIEINDYRLLFSASDSFSTMALYKSIYLLT